MSRIDYDIIAPKAHKLLERLLSAKSNQEALLLYDAYKAFLKEFGWDDKSFDAETLKRVDTGWPKDHYKLLD